MKLENIKKIKRYLFNDLYSLILFQLKYKHYIPKNLHNYEYKDGITAVITSCGRPTKLKIMLTSLIKYADLKFDSIIFVEDSGCTTSVEIAKQFFANDNLKVIFHEKNIGQLKSIDEAYSLVKTKYIFHLEEDWIFIDSGFLQYSLDVFKNNPRLACLSLRPHIDWTEYKLIKKEDYFLINSVHNFIWRGLCINPGLYDKAKYDKLGDYERYYKERMVVQAYAMLGFQSGLSTKINGFVKDNGEGFSTRKKYKTA